MSTGAAAPALPAALVAAYARTDYGAGEAGAAAVARIGRRSAAVDALLARAGLRQGAFVTAWNPWSRRMPRGWNERMLARLRGAARRLPVVAEGWGRGREPIPRAHQPPERRPRPADAWAERHLLVGGDPRRALALARRFRQHAIAAVRLGQPARLLPARGGSARAPVSPRARAPG